MSGRTGHATVLLVVGLLLGACARFHSGLEGGLRSPGAIPAPEESKEKPIPEFESLKWPVKNGRVSQPFVHGDHWGIDIAAPTGTKIYAAHSGHVVYSGHGFHGYGKFVILESGTMATFYSHCQKLLVRQGQWVEQGQLIAKVGRTGNATGPHLHFEVRQNRLPLDPLQYLVVH